MSLNALLLVVELGGIPLQESNKKLTNIASQKMDVADVTHLSERLYPSLSGVVVDLAVDLLSKRFRRIKILVDNLTETNMNTSFIADDTLNDTFDIFKFTLFVTAVYVFFKKLDRFRDVTWIVFFMRLRVLVNRYLHLLVAKTATLQKRGFSYQQLDISIEHFKILFNRP
eukprot:maker-scaffold913_size81748-snap-gene-0.5 protein:Tk11377 transcript:maker-scaffold913_size81748-snap-gene-0.5-mRNA-1 annotation:"hemin abc transporter atp-binding protein"